MTDYPDHTQTTDIIAQTIANLNVDIVAQTLANLSIDIAAQTLAQLAIDIAAQSVGNLDVDLKAQSVGNIDIDINAQSLGDVEMEFNAQAIGVKIEAEWEAHQGNDKVVEFNLANIYDGDENNDTYTVPTGKTFYMTWLTAAWYNDSSADRPNTCIGYMNIEVSGTDYIYHGGNGGAGMTFPTPIPFAAGEVIEHRIYNYSGNQVDGRIASGGYLV